VAKKYRPFFRKGNGWAMKKIILKQLKELSRVRGKETTWVSELNDDQLYELFIRLRNGETSKSIARFIQAAWEVNPRSSVHSIGQGVGKFKRRIAHLLISPTCEVRDSCVEPISECPDSENALESLDHIARLQRSRIMRMMKEEQNTHVKYPFLNRDIQALATLEKVLLKAKSFAISHEHEDPVERRNFERMKERMDKNFYSMMRRLGEDGKNEVIQALDNFLERVEEEAEILETGPDGQLRLIKKEKC
jgi:hypothetical protein